MKRKYKNSWVHTRFSARPEEWDEAEGRWLKLTLPLLLSRRCRDDVKRKYNTRWVHTRCTDILSGLRQLQGCTQIPVGVYPGTLTRAPRTPHLVITACTYLFCLDSMNAQPTVDLLLARSGDLADFAVHPARKNFTALHHAAYLLHQTFVTTLSQRLL